MAKGVYRRAGVGLVVLGGVAAVSAGAVTACDSGGGGTGGGIQVPGPVSTYTPTGCDYAVSMPNGILATLDDGAGSGAATHVHVSFAGPTASTFAVNWKTDTGTTASALLYGTDKAAVEAATAAGTGVSLATGHTAEYESLVGGTTRVHEVHVCGLEASTRYYYKVGGPGGWSAVYEVATGPAIGSTEPYKIAVLGDARDEPSYFATLQERLYAEGAELTLFTGDAVQMGTSQLAWDALFEAQGASGSVESILAGVPLMMSNGNHDSLAVNYLLQFAMPQDASPGESGAGEEWYALDYANAHIVVLNDSTTTEGIAAQTDFLAADLAAVDRAKTPWIFVMHHRALYSSSNHGSDHDLRAAWQPLYDQYQVDMVFNGHDHNYERSLPIRGFDPGTTDGTVATSGADGAPVASSGTVYFVAGGAGAPLYGSGTEYHTYVSESVQNYVLLSIADKAVEVRAYRADGTPLDSFDYAK